MQKKKKKKKRYKTWNKETLKRTKQWANLWKTQTTALNLSIFRMMLLFVLYEGLEISPEDSYP